MNPKPKKSVKFFVSKRMIGYRPPNERICGIISGIGWGPLFTNTSVLQQRFHRNLDENQRRMLVDFLGSYDSSTRSGYVNGSKVFLTEQTATEAFGFHSSKGKSLETVPTRGTSKFRCDLVSKDAKHTIEGLPMKHIEDTEIRRMLQAANVMLTGKPSSCCILRFTVLQAVWESLHRGARFDWPEFVLCCITSHLQLTKQRLQTHGTVTLSLCQQTLLLLEAAAAVAVPTVTVALPPPATEVKQVVTKDKVDPLKELLVYTKEMVAKHGRIGGMTLEENLQLMVDSTKNKVKGLIIACCEGHDQQEKRDPGALKMQIAALEAAGSSQREHLQRFEIANQFLKDKVDRIPSQVSNLKCKLESLDAENAGVRSKLQTLKADISSLQSSNTNLEVIKSSLGVNHVERKMSILEAEHERLVQSFLNEEYKNKALLLEGGNSKLKLQLREVYSEIQQLKIPYREAYTALREQQAENSKLKKRIEDLEELRFVNEGLTEELKICSKKLESMKHEGMHSHEINELFNFPKLTKHV